VRPSLDAQESNLKWRSSRRLGRVHQSQSAEDKQVDPDQGDDGLEALPGTGEQRDPEDECRETGQSAEPPRA